MHRNDRRAIEGAYDSTIIPDNLIGRADDMSDVVDVAFDFEVLRSLVAFAYAQGYHELGYDPVNEIEDRVKATESKLDPLRQEVAMLQKQLHDEIHARTAAESRLDVAAGTCKRLSAECEELHTEVDEWKRYADNGLSSYSEQQAEIARLSSRLGTLESALRKIVDGRFLGYAEAAEIARGVLRETAVEKLNTSTGERT